MSNMMCAEDIVVRFDTSNLVPVEFGSALGTSRTQSSQVVELGKKLLHCAREGDTAAVLDLMAKGAPFTTDWLGTSPLHLAAMNDHVETCDVLLRAGISRDSRTKVDRTPLHLAAYEGHQRVCALLLSHGADVDCRDMLLMTPLHWAVEKCHTDVVRILLEFNADPRAVSKFRRTPLSIAADQDDAPLLAALEAAVLNNINNKHITDTLRATESIQETNENNDIETTILQDMKYTNSMEVDEEGDTNESIENEQQNVLENMLPQVQDESSNAATLQLLREHGITMLPADENTTVMSAIKSGRTIVLSDAGKLMLKEVQKPKMMSKPIQIRKNPVMMPSPSASSSSSTNIKPAPGKVKIYTLSGNQLMAMTQPKHNSQGSNDTLKKAVANAGINFLQVPKPNPVISLAQHPRNYFQMKSISPTKTTSGMQSGKKILGGIQSGKNIIRTSKNAVLNLNQLQSLQKDCIIHLKNASGLPSGVKIIMNKNNFGKFVSNPMIKKTMSDTATTTEENKMTCSTENTTISDNNNERLEESLSENFPDDVDILKRKLMSAQQQIVIYKKTIMEKDSEIQKYKERLQVYEGI